MAARKLLVVVVVVLVALYGLAAYDSSQRVEELEVEVVDVTMSGLVIEVRNPTPYTYTIERLEVRILADGGEVARATLDGPIVVEAGGSERATVELEVGLLGLLSLFSSEKVGAEAVLVVKPSIAGIPLPTVTYTEYSEG